MCACPREISSDGDDGWDSWRNVSETGRLARVFSREERGTEGWAARVWEEARREAQILGRAGVAEVGKREEKRREEKRREER